MEVNHKQVQIARQGSEVCVRVEATGDAPRLYGRHFDHTDTLVSKVRVASIQIQTRVTVCELTPCAPDQSGVH